MNTSGEIRPHFGRRLAAALLLAFLLLPAAWSGRAQARSNIYTDKVLMKGIDVSRWQGRINWTKVKKAGIRFAMIGMGRVYANGSAALDPTFSYNMNAAAANGIHVGVYLYSLASTPAQAQQEARWVLKQIDGYKVDFPVAFDMELPSIQSLGKTTKTNIALAFMKIIKKAGYYPCMYASENWFYQGIDLSRISSYDKWVARWSDGMTFNPVSMWQHSSTGRVNGISTPVDLDYLYKDYASLIKPRYHSKKATYKKGWHNRGSIYWYAGKNGKILKNQFLTRKGKTYYLDENGNRVSGWYQVKDQWYYFTSKGVMRTGWRNIKGKRYYLDPKTGARHTGWMEHKKRIYYFSKKGVLATGWKKIGKKWYYFDEKNGRLYQKATMGKYVFDENDRWACTNYEQLQGAD